jgi:hypothetical protein
MVITQVLKAIENGSGAYLFKKRNRGGMYRRIPVHNAPDDYDDVYIQLEKYEELKMSDQKKNDRGKNNHFLRKLAGIIVIALILVSLIVSGMLRFWLIPQELQSYYQIHQKSWIGYVVLQEQQIRNGKLLAQLTYLNANGQSQIVNDAQVGNAAILGVAYIELPGVGTTGELSGIKLIAIDLQHINAISASNDPPVLSSNAVKLNGGTDGFFSYAQKTSLPTVQATLYIFSTESIKGFGPHCYNIYVTPDLTFTVEPSTGQCISPFTEPLS